MSQSVFLVIFDGAANTRWHDCQLDVQAALQDYLHSFGKVMTRGAIPCVTVKQIFPDEPVTAARPGDGERKVAIAGTNDQCGGSACAAPLPTPTPACQEIL